jgi:putative membrane protein
VRIHAVHTTPTNDSKILDESAIYAIERPHPSLWSYYILASLVSGPALPFLIVYRYFRYHTMRYRFDEEGVSMSWGILFRREINLTYARIQDIHLASNLIERWLGLARIQIQTASGSASAEMTIEGVREFEALRDFLYSKMRGTKSLPAARPAREIATGGAVGTDAVGGDAAELASVLREVAAELRAVRGALAREERRDG